MIEGYFFLLLMFGTGKAATVVGPFKAESECERVREEVQAKHRITAYTHGCWKGPVVR